MNHILLKKLSVCYVIVANILSITFGTIGIFVRDLIVFAFAFTNFKSKYFLFLLSGTLVTFYFLNSDFTIPAFSKFRNFIIFETSSLKFITKSS